MQQGEATSPSSPGEQRRKEKETLKKLNERLEVVLANIRRDNITKARQIRDLEEETKDLTDESTALKDAQRDVDKASKEVIYDKSQQLAKVARNSGVKKQTDVELSNIGAFKTWPGDFSTEYMELSAKIAEKKLLLLRTSVEKAYNDYVVTTIRSAIHEIEATNQNEKIKLDNLRAEETKYQDQLAELNRRNEDAARKVALYENAELEDAMQERIQLAMARKEKVLHAELREKIDAKAKELSDARSKASTSNPSLITPLKIDLYGEYARLEGENMQLEEKKATLEAQLKNANAKQEKLQERVKNLKEKEENLQKSISAADSRRTALIEDIESLKNDTIEDKKTQEVRKQIEDHEANNSVRAARYNKSKQLLLSALDDTETAFRSVVNLDAVLQEYERIIEDYEQRYGVKRRLAHVPPSQYSHAQPSAPPSAPSVFKAPATPPESSKKARPYKSSQVKLQPRSTVKTSQGFPSTAGKETSTRTTTSTEPVSKLVFPEEFEGNKEQPDSEDQASSADTSDDEDNDASLYSTPSAQLPFTTAESGKKKRKEPPQEIVDEAVEQESSSTTSDSPLEITTFSAQAQKVVIKNNSSGSINLNGYKIRNCDYNISQLFPSAVLPANGTFTINPRPKNIPAKLPKLSMFWQDGDYGTFSEKDSKGVRILGPRGELICAKK